MRKIKRSGMLVYFDTRPLLERLSPQDVKELLLALLDYAENGVVPSFQKEALSCCWPLLASRMDADRERYEQRVESNRRAARARWAAHMTENTEAGEETESACMQLDAI